MTDSAATPLRSALELLEAVENNEFRLHYQAIYKLPSLELDGLEALLRWRHPHRGLLAPREFLPDDMDSGLGWALTNFVLEEAIRSCAAWQRGGLNAGVSVNISPGRLADEFLPAHLHELLERHRLSPESLTVEMTEARCDIETEEIRRACRILGCLGVRLSIDDFGTGESTLTRLRRIRLDEIKIDRCFVAGASVDPTDRNIVAFATSLAHSLGMRAVAEGVEDEATLEILSELGVDLAQGYHLHRPAALPAGGVPRVRQPREGRDGTIHL